MNYQTILDEIQQTTKGQAFGGEVASYIPELAKVDPHKFGMHLCSLEGGQYGVGDSEEKFSIQSIVKVLSLVFAIAKINYTNEVIWSRVQVEPSGNPFNSLVQIEYERGIPRNPFINAGALVIADILVSHCDDPKAEFIEFIRTLAHNANIHYNDTVAASEQKTGYRNRAVINLMKSFGNIKNKVDDVLSFYYYTCSLMMTCRELAQTFLFLTNQGITLPGKEVILTKSQSKRINALMQTCGFYDEAGEFSFRVGLPGKSGVGGGIVAVHPGSYSVAVWSPPLNAKGNSAKGMKALEMLTTKTGLSIF
ncbi:glutaminase [Microscilla marina]|uniref:Glutaminase n=1 Tax=Microscilla marina ATCC 23134 TaxID=313606 RepID=A1ZZP7_MICM2|nr:glutaminase [Microscilla marina]EAY24155.1 glutaminase [Microscilla marina ATCC 23134]